MERTRGPVAPRSAFIAVGIVAFLGSTALASHFRGGWMTTSVSPSGLLTVNAVTLWAKGGSQFSDFPLGGLTRTGLVGGVYPARIDLLSGNGLRTVLRSTTNGTLPVPNIIATTTSVDQTNPNFDVRHQTFTFNLPSLGIGFGSYILYWTDAARIEGLHNLAGSQFGGSQSPFSLEACFVYDGTPRATPTIASSIITTVAQGQHYSNNLNASGTAPLSYSFIVGNVAPRYGPSSQIPGLTVDATGEVEIPAVSTAALNATNLAGEPGGDYVFKVVIQDALGQYIEQDVMLDVVATPNQVCGITVSDTSPSVVVGNVLDLIVQVNDPDPLNALTIVTIPASIPNATLTPVGTNPVTAIFHFEPDGSQGGQTIGVNFVATDNGSPPLSCVVNSQITVISNLPPTCEGDFSEADLDFNHPTPGSYVVTEGETIIVPFTGTDPNGDNLTASVTGLPGGASLAPSSGPAPLVATLSWTPTGADKAGAPYTVVVTFDDGAGGSHSCSFVIEDINLKPTCDSGGDVNGSVTYECTSASGAVVMLNGSGTDADDGGLLYHWDVSDMAVVLDNPNIANPTGVFPHGVTMATLTVADGRGGVSSCDLLVNVEDTTPPEVMCTTSVASLWPPNHTMRTVTLVVTATDACEAPEEVIPLIVTVRSDEEDDAGGVGDGQTTGDVDGQDGFSAAVDVSAEFVQGILPGTYVATILLRAERQGTSDGRKYTIDVAALDSSSNIATTSCCVIVPHDRRGSN